MFWKFFSLVLPFMASLTNSHLGVPEYQSTYKLIS